MKVGVEGTEDQGGSQGHPVETSRQRHPVGTCGGLSPQRGVRRVSVQVVVEAWTELGTIKYPTRENGEPTKI